MHADKFTREYAGNYYTTQPTLGTEMPTLMMTEAMANHNIIRQLADPDQTLAH